MNETVIVITASPVGQLAVIYMQYVENFRREHEKKKKKKT
jgi:hypothetical protein